MITRPNAYAIPIGRAYRFNPAFDARNEFRTRSVSVIPLQGLSGDVIGVLQLINARNARGHVVAFHPQRERVVRALASQAAVGDPQCDARGSCGSRIR